MDKVIGYGLLIVGFLLLLCVINFIVSRIKVQSQKEKSRPVINRVDLNKTQSKYTTYDKKGQLRRVK